MTLLTTDRALLTAYRAGDREALARVYREYARPLAAFLRGGFNLKSGDAEHFFQGITSAYELDNALQEIFTRAFSDTARQRYDGIRPFTSYLFAIARNWVIDEGRRRKARRFETLDNEAVEERPDEVSAPAESVEADEIAKLIASFLSTRDDEERRLYTLRFEQGLSQADAARALEMSRIQVRRREAKLLRDLLRHFRTHGYLAHAEVAGTSLSRTVLADIVIFLILWGRA